jgi:hypothetical protein
MQRNDRLLFTQRNLWNPLTLFLVAAAASVGALWLLGTLVA